MIWLLALVAAVVVGWVAWQADERIREHRRAQPSWRQSYGPVRLSHTSIPDPGQFTPASHVQHRWSEALAQRPVYDARFPLRNVYAEQAAETYRKLDTDTQERIERLLYGGYADPPRRNDPVMDEWMREWLGHD